jgi:hypothetical protein
MPAACFPCVTFQGAVFDRLLWDGDPFSLHQHLNSAIRNAVLRWTAIALVAAALPEAIFKSHVDVVGVRRA